ncbi:hypothetical protein GCM10027046_35660 [Uliginosibacterium flavum]|uniref:Alpha-1,2-glucosyltransferase n=1 Tax=Uliginosibacterium flavum TaxID=1396831 RepID=A0ABV2TPL2_9RHOO
MEQLDQEASVGEAGEQLPLVVESEIPEEPEVVLAPDETVASALSLSACEPLAAAGSSGSSAWSGWLSGVCVLLGAVFGFALVSTHPGLINDEGFHGPQIWNFFTNNFTILGSTTMIPSYHAVLALVAKLLGYYSDSLHRLVTLLVGLAMPWLAFRMVKLHAPLAAGRRAVQLFYFPILFPFFFLIYTDVWTTTAIIATCLCAMNRRFLLAGLTGLVAVLLRQDAVIWVGLAWLLVAFDGSSMNLRQLEWRKIIANACVRGLPLLAVMLLFVGFVFWNKGVAVGDRSQHQSGFTVTNIYVFLFCGWLMFLPMNLEAVPRILTLLRKPAVVACLILGFLIYMGSYSNTHGYNGEGMRFWLHNELLYWPTKFLSVRALAYLGVAWMALTLCVTRLAQPRFYWLYAVAVLAAAMHPLIEPRYYLPGLLLLQICRPELDETWENAQLVLSILLSAGLLFGTVIMVFFI